MYIYIYIHIGLVCTIFFSCIPYLFIIITILSIATGRSPPCRRATP